MTYSEYYERYLSTHAGLRGREDHVLRRDIVNRLPQDRSAVIVDLGCGQGGLVTAMRTAGYGNASGVDISPEQVDVAHGRGELSVHCGDAIEYLETRDQLSCVTATDFFEHLGKPEVTHYFRSIRALLAENGRLIGRVPNGVSPFFGNYQYGDFTHETIFTAGSIRQCAAVAGFSRVQIFSCPPVVHGLRSAVRAGLWMAVGSIMKFVLAVETGRLRGHYVTQNLVFVAYK